jgi:hypothetical protein
VDGKEVARNSMGHSTPITFPEDESFNLTFNLEPVQEAEADVKHLPAPDASAIGTED